MVVQTGHELYYKTIMEHTITYWLLQILCIRKSSFAEHLRVSKYHGIIVLLRNHENSLTQQTNAAGTIVACCYTISFKV